jgi:hypothetical protein
MATGPHPDPLVRAEYFEWANHLVEEAVIAVCDALTPFFTGATLELMRRLIVMLETVRREARSVISREQEFIPVGRKPAPRDLQLERLPHAPPHELLEVIRNRVRRSALAAQIA